MVTSEFSIQGNIVFHTSNTPGNHVMLSIDGSRAIFRRDFSSFDDVHRRYVWAFEYVMLREGARVILCTDDRRVIVVYREGEFISIVDEPSVVPSLLYSSGAGAPPKVSVATCSHNRPDLLRAAVESMRAQTDDDWEHLICDDASTDPRVSGVLAWAAEDPRVRVWRRSENVDRPGALWNFMLDRARGRYFTVLDDDNEKLPTFIATMSRALDDNPQLDFITCGFVVVVPDTGQVDDYHINLNTNEEALARGSTCDGGAILYRRETFERAGYFSEAIRTNEDWDWLRRAAHGARFENLRECLSTYRFHKMNRMTRCEELGNTSDVETVRRRNLQAVFGVRVVRPAFDRLTCSQRDAVNGICQAIASIPWVAPGEDLAVIVSPFQMSNAEMMSDIGNCQRVLSIHMEDPYALATNLERVRSLVASRETWVSTNDISTVDHYRKIVGDRIIVCPLLGANESIARDIEPTSERDIDVLFCGYAYPSRRRLLDDLLPRLVGRRVALVGDGWEDRSVYLQLPTQGLAETYAIHARAKTVVCLHRTSGDCSDGPVEPASLNRGFMEGRFGARVFVDRLRSHHALDPGDVVQYDDVVDLVEKINQYFDHEDASLAMRFADKCAQLYAYEIRIARILNCVRAPRFLAEIP